MVTGTAAVELRLGMMTFILGLAPMHRPITSWLPHYGNCLLGTAEFACPWPVTLYT